MLDSTFSYNRKKKLLASELLRWRCWTPPLPSSLPVADVAKVMDTCHQAMRTTRLENGQRNPCPRTSYLCHNPAALLLACRGQGSGGLFLSLTSDPDSWCALKGECARPLPSSEGKALPTLMPPRSGSRIRLPLQWADGAGLSYATLGWMTGDEALYGPPQACGVQSQALGSQPQPASVFHGEEGLWGSEESRPWSHTTAESWKTGSAFLACLGKHICWVTATFLLLFINKLLEVQNK